MSRRIALGLVGLALMASAGGCQTMQTPWNRDPVPREEPEDPAVIARRERMKTAGMLPGLSRGGFAAESPVSP